MKIYISATYRDLQKHRLAVATVLRRMGHQPIGMEDYVAEGTRPLHRCLADVMACDAYVGIIAWRYGFVPTDAGAAGTPLPAGTSLGSSSITEFEFRQAVQLEKPVLMFLLDSEAEWPSSQFDALSGIGDGKAISRLRQEVGQQHLISYFRTPEELASLVSSAVYRVEMSRQMTLDSLHIEPRFNQPFVRNGPVADSTLMEIKTVIAGPREAQALNINVGQGLDWWMTRLYFLSSLAADLTLIEVLVFVGEAETFIGITNPTIVKERLAQAYPLIKRYEDVLAQSGAWHADLPSEVDRRANLWTTQMTSTGGEHSNPIFVTKSELVRWLTPYMVTQAIDWEPGDNAALQMQRLMDWPMRFVPVVEKGRFTRIVDKQALSEQIARIFVREQVSRALSMTR
jgi:Domain of unknown function (DUF4062)